MICNTVSKTITDNSLVMDISGWDYVVLQLLGRAGTIDVTASNTSSIDPSSPATATDFVAVQVTKLSDGTAVTTLAANGLYRVGVVGRFLKLAGVSAAGTVNVMFGKIF